MINKEIEKALKSMRIFARVHQDMTTVTAEDMEIVLQYIEQLENKVKELGKGQHTLMQSRRKWKNRYYKEKRKNENNK